MLPAAVRERDWVWLSRAQCGQCCPKNYTEAYFEEDHSRYSSHPAVLLAQASLSDNHADLCASTNYCERQTKHDNTVVQPSSLACCKVLLRHDDVFSQGVVELASR